MKFNKLQGFEKKMKKKVKKNLICKKKFLFLQHQLKQKKIMTTKQLEERVSWKWCGYGTYDVTIIFRGKRYHCRSHNTLANDDYQCKEHRSFYKSDKQCLMSFYDECKRINNLGEYCFSRFAFEK